MLSREFTWLILVAFVVAVPLGYFITFEIDLAHRVSPVKAGPLVFVLAGLLMLSMAWLSASYLSIRAARANPVDSLRDE